MPRDVTLLLGRLLLVAIFPISAYYKIIGWPGIVGMLNAQGLPLASVGGYGAIVVELLGALLVAIGLFTRPAALALIVYVAATSAIAHRFWEFTGPAQFGQIVSFMKNLAMIGGLAILAVVGPGRYALRP